MKKLIVIFTMVAMAMSMVACGSQDEYHRTPKEDDVPVKEINVVTVEEETILTEEILYENVITENVTYWEDVGWTSPFLFCNIKSRAKYTPYNEHRQ